MLQFKLRTIACVTKRRIRYNLVNFIKLIGLSLAHLFIIEKIERGKKILDILITIGVVLVVTIAYIGINALRLKKP